MSTVFGAQYPSELITPQGRGQRPPNTIHRKNAIVSVTSLAYVSPWRAIRT